MRSFRLCPGLALPLARSHLLIKARAMKSKHVASTADRPMPNVKRTSLALRTICAFGGGEGAGGGVGGGGKG